MLICKKIVIKKELLKNFKKYIITPLRTKFQLFNLCRHATYLINLNPTVKFSLF